MRIIIPNYVSELIRRLEDCGEEAYIVGGGLRDSLLGSSPSDYDMTTSALPEKMLEIFADYRTVETGMKHGTLTVLSHGAPIEITTFRIDGGYTDSRHPDGVSFTRSLREDLARRDFTVNAMAYNESVGLVDEFGGLDDLRREIIRAVGEPHKRFSEDALRIMRAFRFCAQLGFEIEEQTLLATGECREGLANIARERIFAELLKLLRSSSSEVALKAMRDHGVLYYILGDYCPSERIFSLMRSAPESDTARLGLLLCEAEEERKREILASLRCSNRQRGGTMAVSIGALMSVDSEREVSRFLSKYGADAPDALRVSVLLGNSDEKILELAEKNKAPRTVGDLAVSGNDIAALGFCGKEIGRVLSMLLCMSIDDPTLNSREVLLSIAKEQNNKGKREE